MANKHKRDTEVYFCIGVDSVGQKIHVVHNIVSDLEGDTMNMKNNSKKVSK